MVTINSLYYYEDTRSFKSTCYQALPKSYIWLKITFSNSVWPRMKEELDKSTFLQISGVFGLVNTFSPKSFSEKNPVMHLNKHIFQSQKLQKYLSYEVHIFFQKIGNFMYIPKMLKQCSKKSMVFQIIWFELVTVNSLY